MWDHQYPIFTDQLLDLNHFQLNSAKLSNSAFKFQPNSRESLQSYSAIPLRGWPCGRAALWGNLLPEIKSLLNFSPWNAACFRNLLASFSVTIVATWNYQFSPDCFYSFDEAQPSIWGCRCRCESHLIIAQFSTDLHFGFPFQLHLSIFANKR